MVLKISPSKVPTDSGYRYYVDELLEQDRLPATAEADVAKLEPHAAMIPVVLGRDTKVSRHWLVRRRSRRK